MNGFIKTSCVLSVLMFLILNSSAVFSEKIENELNKLIKLYSAAFHESTSVATRIVNEAMVDVENISRLIAYVEGADDTLEQEDTTRAKESSQNNFPI